MNLLSLVLISLVLAICNGIYNAPQNKFVPPADWKAIKACGVRFYVPANFREETVHPIDSCVAQYRNRNTLLVLDVIMYSDPNGSRQSEYSNKRDFNLRQLNIDGQNAEIITCYETEVPPESQGLNYSAVLYVPQLPKARGNLTVWTSSKSTEARDLAVKILESMQFPK